MNRLRRRFLLSSLAALGFFTLPSLARAGLGKVPQQLKPETSIYSLNGDVKVNGVSATINGTISANDTVVTGHGSQITFKVGEDAFILREKSELKLSGEDKLIHKLELMAGAILSVFGKSNNRDSKPLHMHTPTAVLAIRGTAVFVEAQPDVSYICSCYGKTEISSQLSPQDAEVIESKHHDAPRYIYADGKKIPAPCVNHKDEDIMLIESLVGRTTPFLLLDDSYGGPKRY